MKIFAKKYYIKSVMVIICLLAFCTLVDASTDLNPVGIPSATMKTLENIYQRISTGVAAGSHNDYPSSAIAGTMHTLTDIYSIIPNNDRVCSGTNGGTAICAPNEWSGEIVGMDEDYYYATSFCEGNNNSPWIGRSPTIGELSKAIAQQFAEGGTGPAVFVDGKTYFSGMNADDFWSWWSASYSAGTITLLREDAPGGVGSVRCVH